MAFASHPPSALGLEARRKLLAHLRAAAPTLARLVGEALDQAAFEVTLPTERQQVEDARVQWRDAGGRWADLLQRSLTTQHLARSTDNADETQWTLVNEETVEIQILAGRLAHQLAAPSHWEYSDLRLRLQDVDRVEELAPDDVVQAAQIALRVMQTWMQSGMTREMWLRCKPSIEQQLPDLYTEACHLANAYLLGQGVLPQIDLRKLLRRASSDVSAPAAAGTTPAPTTHGLPNTAGAPAPHGTAAGHPGLLAETTRRLKQLLGRQIPAMNRWLDAAQAAHPAAGAPRPTGAGGPARGLAGGGGGGGGGGNGQGGGAAPANGHAAAHPPGASGAHASTLLLTVPVSPAGLNATPGTPVDPAVLQAGVAALRQQTRALKQSASSEQDKAVIEVVALIFDSILAEERLPPSIRVWFARLQMPVLRVALVDADFLGSTDHPARLLLDRMGGCVMGFDAGVSLEPLEAEMRRVVQVVEQYPETGRKVFEIVHKEFEAFLSQHLLERGQTRKLANLAEQVELKETLTVKFTIELRKLLGQAPVAEPVRDFLFHVWAEVLAVATVRHGAQHAVSTGFRAVAGELLWMASAKPTRAERAKVIGRLPGLMAQLRDGMTLLGLDSALQEQRIKQVSDALVEAFMARTQPLSDQLLQDMTQRLASLDDYLADTEVEQIKLDQYSIEMITGVDASDITVVPDTEQKVSAALRAWAKALERGAWFELSHNGFASLVQLSWRSPQQQLFLFAGSERRSFLLQQGRVAVYLEAGLLKPCEPESLTLRATRDALNKLDANPERLLA